MKFETCSKGSGPGTGVIKNEPIPFLSTVEVFMDFLNVYSNHIFSKNRLMLDHPPLNTIYL